MQFLRKYDITGEKLLKFIGVLIGAIIVIALISSLFKLSYYGSGPSFVKRGGFGIPAPMIEMPYGGSVAYDASESAGLYQKGMPGAVPELSLRNVSRSILPPAPAPVPGADAEEFEVTDYNATIESRTVKETCDAVQALKAREYVIFENANEGDSNCYYTFKVEHAKVREILGIIEGLKPKDLTENTYTIKRQIDDLTSEEEILSKKLESIDSTLRSALLAYDEITRVATRAGSAEALAKIIDSKVGIIERLTSERINVTVQLERLSRAKEEQLDRLKYTYFNVSVYERKFFDGEALRESWKQELRELVMSINLAIQSVTTKLLVFVLWLLPIAIYALLLVVVAKYGWRLLRTIWKS